MLGILILIVHFAYGPASALTAVEAFALIATVFAAVYHAENDYSTVAGQSLAAELERLHKPHSLKIYPNVGLTPDDGHNMLYENIPAWEDDVFTFLDQHVKR